MIAFKPEARDNNRDDVDAGPAYSPDDQKRFPENQDLRESPLEGE